jgi:hypothetical protein
MRSEVWDNKKVAGVFFFTPCLVSETSFVKPDRNGKSMERSGSDGPDVKLNGRGKGWVRRELKNPLGFLKANTFSGRK